MKILLAAFVLLGGSIAVSAPSSRLDYLVRQDRSFKIERQQLMLDSLGHEGWELVSTNAIQINGTTGAVLFYFKRPEQSGAQ